jgi:hypothetical protein
MAEIDVFRQQSEAKMLQRARQTSEKSIFVHSDIFGRK